MYVWIWCFLSHRGSLLHTEKNCHRIGNNGNRIVNLHWRDILSENTLEVAISFRSLLFCMTFVVHFIVAFNMPGKLRDFEMEVIFKAIFLIDFTNRRKFKLCRGMSSLRIYIPFVSSHGRRKSNFLNRPHKKGGSS